MTFNFLGFDFGLFEIALALIAINFAAFAAFGIDKALAGPMPGVRCFGTRPASSLSAITLP